MALIFGIGSCFAVQPARFFEPGQVRELPEPSPNWAQRLTLTVTDRQEPARLIQAFRSTEVVPTVPSEALPGTPK